jgi:outer membrane protein assembly factor BamB
MPIYLRMLVVFVAAGAISLTGCNVAVLTYHNDNFRTGWNKHERKLTYSTVNESLLTSIVVPLDDQLDAQPLVVPRVKITAGPHHGTKHDVVYVATANNTVYALDASTGKILLQQNFGPPVAAEFLAVWPGHTAPGQGCGDNGPNVGITGTPVIDRRKNRMYVITYTLEAAPDGPTYKVHALDLGSLAEQVAAQKVTASHTMNDGKTFVFNGTYQRQRPGLLLANGNVYAGFGSYCDWGDDQSRGWVLGWNADTLTPLPSNELNDRLDVPGGTALSSVWMSGYALAADEAGSLYFVTGNSYVPYDGTNNIQESVVKSSSDLSHFSLFTPSNAETALDPGDVDFGSGGALLLPSPVASRSLAAAAGKDGRMFILDRSNLGGYNPGGPDNVVYTVPAIGACWCGQSYFDDGSPHIVSSGGTSVNLWGFQTSPQISLVGQGSSENLPSAAVGFLTSVSSRRRSNAIVWAVSRPDMSSGSPLLWLYAFKAVPGGASSSLPRLFHAVAGVWSPTAFHGANSSSVPVVANGKVYVGSYQQLAIFGLDLPGGHKAHDQTFPKIPRSELGPGQHEVFGILVSAENGRLKVRDRTGKIIEVNATVAVKEFHSVPLGPGRALRLVGTYDAAGVLHVPTVLRARMSPADWPSDR